MTLANSGRPILRRLELLLRLCLFLYAALVWCPIRFCSMGFSWDNTWVFAANFAAANGLVNGRDVFWTTGPLGYLVFPQAIGDNLRHGLQFQLALWAALIAALFDVFLLARFALGGTVIFAICLGLSSPLYWFNSVGLENLLLASALLLITVYRWRGGRVRYLAALAMIGVIPLIKLSGGFIAVAALAGFAVDRALAIGRKATGDILLSIAVPGAVAAAIVAVMAPSMDVYAYVKVSLDLVKGYGGAMSYIGPSFELIACLGVAALGAAVLAWEWWMDSAAARFHLLILGAPVLISIKHGFVRQDNHIVNFFCMAALAFGLICLKPVPSRGQDLLGATVVVALGVLWHFTVIPASGGAFGFKAMATGLQSFAYSALAAGGVDALHRRLAAEARTYTGQAGIEAELKAIIGDAEVASLSIAYNWVPWDGLRLKLYPVVQRYAAYTPYLDDLNAKWVSSKGPRFLIFDGLTIDSRSILAETPATWLEVYRWYDSRLVGKRNLLLERRLGPRFTALESLGGRRQAPMAGMLAVPAMTEPVFLAMHCSFSTVGALGSLALRVPEVRMAVHQGQASIRSRIVPQSLTNPMIANAAPATLAELAALFAPGGGSGSIARPVENLSFDGPGLAYYQPACGIEFFRAVGKPVNATSH